MMQLRGKGGATIVACEGRLCVVNMVYFNNDVLEEG
jgi:hypothetical protein